MISVISHERRMAEEPISRNLKHCRWAPKKSKSFQNVDSRALEVTTSEYRTFDELAWDLVFQWNYDDLKRARAVFQWIAIKNFKTIAFEKAELGSAEEAIFLYRNGKIDHAELFCRLIRTIGLCCVVIEGLTKGTLNKAEEIELKPHRWNAVRVEDRWRLVDICWAKRQLKDAVSKDFDSIYFCSDPNHLIYTHLPNDSKWQLLDPPISEELFLSFPLLNPHFFQAGLLLLEFSGVLETYNGSVRIPIGHSHYFNGRFDGEHFESTFFSFNFTEFNSRSITGFVLQETKKDEEIFYIRCPHIGAYHFTIFYSLPWLPKTITTNKLRCYKAVCQYKIICHSNPKSSPFPLSKAPIGWGSHLLPLTRFQIVPSHASAILTTKKRKLDLFFHKLKSEVRLFAVLLSNGKTSRELDQYIRIVERRFRTNENAIQQSVKNNSTKKEPQVLVSINLPRPGEYCLEIYANDPHIDGNIFVLLSRHLIVNRNPGETRDDDWFADDEMDSVDGGSYFRKREMENSHPGNVTNCKNIIHCRHHDFERTYFDQREPYPIPRYKMEDRPQIIFAKMKEFNQGQEINWNDFKPRRCYNFKFYSEPSSHTPQRKFHDDSDVGCGDDGMNLTHDDHVLHEDQTDWKGLEMRSDAVYQSRLKLRMATSESSALSETRRSLILLRGQDVSNSTKKLREKP